MPGLPQFLDRMTAYVNCDRMQYLEPELYKEMLEQVPNFKTKDLSDEELRTVQFYIKLACMDKVDRLLYRAREEKIKKMGKVKRWLVRELNLKI